ncbi:MAG: WD40/YVTN/BNR-like repeat-containing protein [Candidatus Dormibacteria bacterium]
MKERLTPEALRARVRAAIGEPDLTGRGFDLDTARARKRRWYDLGLGAAPAPVRVSLVVALAGAVAAVLTVGAVLQLRSLPKPAGSATGPAGTSQSTPSPSAQPTSGLVPLGPVVDGFVPLDVTAVSASEWWVLGSDSAGCSGTACARILHTLDGGQTFTSIPTPSGAVTGLRFLNPEDGWAYGATTVWSTHDGGATWNATPFGGMTVDQLETYGAYVYAIVEDTTTPATWSLARSPAASDGWQVISSLGAEQPGNLNVHGDGVWMSQSNGQGDNVVLASVDDGAHFAQHSICPGASGVASLYDVSSEDLWATCAMGTSEDVWRSVDGGATFTEVQTSTSSGEPDWGTIGATSASNAVLAGTSLQLTVDGGQSFQQVLSGYDCSIVGFTTAEDGFAFSYPSGSLGTPDVLWRTDDAGAQWHEVQFP